MSRHLTTNSIFSLQRSFFWCILTFLRFPWECCSDSVHRAGRRLLWCDHSSQDEINDLVCHVTISASITWLCAVRSRTNQYSVAQHDCVTVTRISTRREIIALCLYLHRVTLKSAFMWFLYCGDRRGINFSFRNGNFEYHNNTLPHTYTQTYYVSFHVGLT